MASPCFTRCPGTTTTRLTGPLTWVITGVVLNALYATVPVSRSVLVNVVGSTSGTWTCDICSCGMVNSSGSLGFFAYVTEFELGPSHPNKASRVSATAKHSMFLIMAGSSLPPLLSTVPRPSYTKRAPGDSPFASRDNCARHQENPGGWRLRACRHTR